VIRGEKLKLGKQKALRKAEIWKAESSRKKSRNLESRKQKSNRENRKQP
jgi:hypothetical protein